jgi:hypothetical protein
MENPFSAGENVIINSEKDGLNIADASCAEAFQFNAVAVNIK